MSDNIQENDAQVAGSDFDLMHYWHLFWGTKFFIAGMGILLAIPVAVYMSGLQSVYESTASLLVDPNQMSNVSPIDTYYGVDTRSNNYYNTQYELLRSRNMAERVIRRLNLLEHPEFVPQPEPEGAEPAEPPFWKAYIPAAVQDFLDERQIQAAAAEIPDEPVPEGVVLNRVLNSFGNRLRVAPAPGTSIVRVSFQATDPELAADVANEVARTYIESNLEQRISSTEQASQWLSQRVSSLSETLRQSQQRLQNFLETEELVDVGGVSTLSAQELDELNRQAIEAQRRRIELENQYLQIQMMEDPGTADLLAFPFILNHPLVQQARQSADQVEQEIAELSARYGRNHPQMISRMNEQERLQVSLRQTIQQLVDTIGSEYRAAVRTEESTQARLERSKEQQQGINRKVFELRELEREVETNQQLYDMFFTRVRETQETDDLMTTNATIVDPAVPAAYPVGPQRRRAVMLALMAGLMLGGGLVLLRDMLDSSLKNHNDVEQKLKAVVLGIVPLVRPDKKSRKKDKDYKKENREKDKQYGGRDGGNNSAYLGFLKDKRSAFSESFRTIRTSITLSSLDKPYKVISVTSTVPGEGKTTTSINLASAMGQVGEVLLIETDLRRPTFSTSIYLPKDSPGLSNYLAGSNPLDACLYPLKSSGITIMPAGHYVPNPLELLSSNKFKTLLQELGERYDQIILDAPPAMAVSDSLVLGTLSDAVVYVVQADKTPAKMARRQLTRLNKANINVIGVVLNQVDVEKSSDYGGYYDSYGYSEEPQSA